MTATGHRILTRAGWAWLLSRRATPTSFVRADRARTTRGKSRRATMVACPCCPSRRVFLRGRMVCPIVRAGPRNRSPAFGASTGPDACSFCGITGREFVVVGHSGLWMCPYCVGLFEQISREGDGTVTAECSCSFCGASGRTLRGVVVGPRVAVCDLCAHDGSDSLQRAPLPWDSARRWLAPAQARAA
jgi:hypothetical protein